MSTEIIDKYINEESKFIEVMGLDVHYRDEGEGTPILLIHGILSSLHTFDNWVSLLKKDFRLIRVDLPGFGFTSNLINEHYGINFYCNFFNEFLNKLKIKKCHIAGNSMGGWIAWEYALRFPNKINKLVLIDAAGLLPKDEYPLPVVMAQTNVLKGVLRYTPKTAIRRILRQVFTNQKLISEETVDRYYDMFHYNGNLDAFIKISNTKIDASEDKLEDIKNSTLIMWGEDDGWIPIKYAYKFHNSIPNSTIVTYKNTGHLPMEEVPKRSARDLKLFLL